MAKSKKKTAQPVESVALTVTAYVAPGSNPEQLAKYVQALLRQADTDKSLGSVAVESTPVRYAVVEWMPDDVVAVAEVAGRSLTREKAEEWLGDKAKYICDQLVEKGHEIIGDLLREDDNEDEDDG